MFVRFTSVVVVALLAVPAFAQPPKKDAAADILAKLREPSKLDAPSVVLGDLVSHLSEMCGIPVVVNVDAFTQCGIEITDAQLILPRSKGLRLRTVLSAALAPKTATFLVRKDHIEILPASVAARQLKLPEGQMGEPVVSVVVKEKPLNEVAADLAEEFDLNVVVAPQAGDSRMAFVSARLLNVPADKALDVLATAADLRVVRKGNVYLITSHDHATAMFGEKMDRERQKIELEKLREAPANPFGPLNGSTVAPPPAPKPDEKK